jgi:hypothetical protein
MYRSCKQDQVICTGVYKVATQSRRDLLLTGTMLHELKEVNTAVRTQLRIK